MTNTAVPMVLQFDGSRMRAEVQEMCCLWQINNFPSGDNHCRMLPKSLKGRLPSHEVAVES